MSLYNMLFGVRPGAPHLLAALGLDPAAIERFRDARLAHRGEEVVIRILCRTGGGNREDYPNRVLVEHPAYLGDEDDDYDSTYAHYDFRLPSEFRKGLESAAGGSLDELPDDESLRSMFERAVKAIQDSGGGQ